MMYKRRFAWFTAAMVLSLMVSFPALSEDLADTAGEPLFLSSAEDSWDSASETVPGEEEAQFPDASAFVGMAEDWVAPAFPASEEEPLLEEETIPSPSRITAILKPGASLAYGDPAAGSWSLGALNNDTGSFDDVTYSFYSGAVLDCVTVEAVFTGGTQMTLNASSEELSVVSAVFDRTAKATLCRIEYQELNTEIAIPTLTLLEKYPNIPLLKEEEDLHISYDARNKMAGVVRYVPARYCTLVFDTIKDGEENDDEPIMFFVLDGFDLVASGVKDCVAEAPYDRRDYCVITFPNGHRSTGYTLRGYSLPNGSFRALSQVEPPTVENIASGIKVTWKSVERARDYEIYRMTDGVPDEGILTTTGECSFVDKNVQNGHVYDYQILAAQYYSAETYTSFICEAPSDPRGVLYLARVSKPSCRSLKKAVSLSWKKNPMADGYEIRYSKNKSFAGAKTVTVSKAKGMIGKLKSGKKYYFAVRAYRIVSGKEYYSAWSKTGSVKTK